MKIFSARFIAGLKIFLIGVIVFSLSYSVYLDCRPSQMPRINAMGSELPFTDLLTLEKEEAVLEPAEIKKYLRYFELLSEEANAASEVYASIGFCYYHLGDQKKAMLAYQKAVSLNPYFLGFQYNLGVIYFEQGEYTKALESFQKALNTKVDLNIFILRSSKILGFIIHQSAPLDPPLSERLKRTYGLSAYWASRCSGQLGDPRTAVWLRRQSIKMGIDGTKKIVRPRLYLF